jgi:hypothetical protein
MAQRLIQWLARPAGPIAGVGAAVQAQLDEWGWVDRGRDDIWVGEDGHHDLQAAHRQLYELVRDRRRRLDREFAAKLAAFTAAETDPGDILTVETVLPRVVISRSPTGDVRWWTRAGYRANMTLRSSLSEVTDAKQQVTDEWLRLRSDLMPDMWRVAVEDSTSRLCLPEPDAKALAGLKFNAALPVRLAERTLAARLADLDAAAAVLAAPRRRCLSRPRPGSDTISLAGATRFCGPPGERSCWCASAATHKFLEGRGSSCGSPD